MCVCGVLTIKREVVSLFFVYFLSEPIFEVRLITCAKECNKKCRGEDCILVRICLSMSSTYFVRSQRLEKFVIIEYNLRPLSPFRENVKDLRK